VVVPVDFLRKSLKLSMEGRVLEALSRLFQSLMVWGKKEF
jgi:hypothetical protein